MVSLLELLGNLNLVPDCNDGWIWKLNRNRCFTSKSFNVELSNTIRFSIPHKGIWKSGTPSKVSIFLLNTYLDKILTLNHLQGIGWHLANRCVLSMEKESVRHLFIHCSMAKVVWAFFLSHLQISWIFTKLFIELLLGWWISNHDSFFLSIWWAFPGFICWSCWRKETTWFLRISIEARVIWWSLFIIPSLIGSLYGLIMRSRCATPYGVRSCNFTFFSSYSCGLYIVFPFWHHPWKSFSFVFPLLFYLH